MHLHHSRKWLVICVAVALMTGCGGDKKPDSDGEEPVNVTVPDYALLEEIPVSIAPFEAADETRVTQSIKNGIRLQLANGSYYRDQFSGGFWSSSSSGGGWSSTGSSASSASSASSSSSGSAGSSTTSSGNPGGQYTETNVHVAGVDEADWIKYDGKHWFMAVQSNNRFNVVNYASIAVIETDPQNADAEVVGLYEYEDEHRPLKDFYLLRDGEDTTHLVSIRTKPGNVPTVLPGWEGNLSSASLSDDLRVPKPVNATLTVDLIDVTVPSSPKKSWQSVIDGTLLESRKIGSTLYLVTRFDPWLQGITYDNGDVSARKQNEAILAEADYGDLAPHIRIGDSSQPLSEGCLLQSDLESDHGLSSLIHITAIDLADQKLLSSLCVNSDLEVLSMSEENLYLTGTVYDYELGQNRTAIHKFSVSDQGLTYKATGNVSGVLGWLADPVFRMHEFMDDFRIVTTHATLNGPRHSLYILEESSGELKTVSVLPNAERPDPIGKPNEDIRSVRFDENNAYIVTFRQTDPLYKIDLSDREDPKIAGELEITGFATYMHPIGSHYLFTLGREANEWGGVKAELIDVSGGDPVVVNKILLGNQFSSSDALNNLRAFNILPMNNGTVRIAFPVVGGNGRFGDTSSTSSSGWGGAIGSSSSSTSGWSGSGSTSSASTSSSASSTGGWSSSSSGGSMSYAEFAGLKLLEITGVDGPDAELRDVGELRAGDNVHASAFMRGLLHEDAVYLIYDSAIWAAFWNSPEKSEGPILIEPSVCQSSAAVNGLEVTMISLAEETVDACKAKITATDGEFSEVLKPISPSSVDNTCHFAGILDRPGSYELIGSLVGHRTSHPITVPVLQGICSVKTQNVGFQLFPN